MLELSQYAEAWIDASDMLEMAVARSSFNVCFVYKGDGKISNDLNLAIRSELHRQGTILIGYVYIGHQVVLRLLIANSDMIKTDLDAIFEQGIEKSYVTVQMCFILVHVGLRSVLVLLEKAYMDEDGVQPNSYDIFIFII